MRNAVLWCVSCFFAVTLHARMQAELPSPVPQEEDASYLVTDELDSGNSGYETWKRKGFMVSIFADEQFVALIKTNEKGTEETTVSARDPIASTYAFPVAPRSLPDKTELRGLLISTNRLSQVKELSEMTVKVERFLDLIVIHYEVQDEEARLQHIFTYRRDSYLPEKVEFIFTNNEKIREHILKKRIPVKRQVESAP